MTQPVQTEYLKSILTDAHNRTMELVTGLDEEQVMGPKLPIVNPLRWEIGHVAWFHEKFILRDLYGHEPLLANGDDIYDSISVHHEVRWDLPLLSMPDTIKYVEDVMHGCLDRLPGGMASEQDSYMYQFAAYHQDMHNEAYTYTRQTLGHPEPIFANAETQADAEAGAYPGDAMVPGGTVFLGASKNAQTTQNQPFSPCMALKGGGFPPYRPQNAARGRLFLLGAVAYRLLSVPPTTACFS